MQALRFAAGQVGPRKVIPYRDGFVDFSLQNETKTWEEWDENSSNDLRPRARIKVGQNSTMPIKMVVTTGHLYKETLKNMPTIICPHKVSSVVLPLVIGMSSIIPTIVDDRDIRIGYSGGWQEFGSIPQAINTTSHLARAPGTTASFSFNGTFIAVYGTIGAPGLDPIPISTYVLDGGTPVTFNATPESLAARIVGQSLYQQQFFASPTLQDTGHTLVIESIPNNTWFWLDYLLVSFSTAPTSMQIPTLSSSTIPSATLAPTPITLSSTIPSATLAPTPITVSSSSSKPKVAAIAGGVVGGVALLIVIVFLYLIVRLQRKHVGIANTKAIPLPRSVPGGSVMVEPYTISSLPSNRIAHNAETVEPYLLSSTAPIEGSVRPTISKKSRLPSSVRDSPIPITNVDPDRDLPPTYRV